MPKSAPSDIFGTNNVVRLAAVLGMTSAARTLRPEDVARDAIDLERAIRRARNAAAAARPSDKLALKVREIAGRYDAEIVNDADGNQITFGLRFLDGSFAGMGCDVFRVC